MKKTIALLLACVLLLLTACAQKPQPVPAPEEPEAPAEAAEPAPEEAAEEAPEEIPAEPAATEEAVQETAEAPAPAPEEPEEPALPETSPAYTTCPAEVLAEPLDGAAVLTTVDARTEVEVVQWGDPYASILLGEETGYIACAQLHEITGDWNGYIVAIDAGHQAQANHDMEPIGPGASEMKIKVSSGTTGTTTGIPEYELTLALSLKLQTILEERGYHVIMTRTTHDVDISNIERAELANEAKADAFIRVHANGSENSADSGALTICQTASNPYNGDIFEPCHALSSLMLDELVAATGCKKGFVWKTDTMCGINWCEIPVTIVEVGFMTNPEEDALLATDEYRALVAEGMANGVDAFLFGAAEAE